MDQSGSTDIALRVTNAYKSFNNKTKIINGLNMTVPQGCIYGLLGPSGCGKTTLLNSIMGTQVLDFGVIDIRVKSKKDIGYMPQALCLDKHLTVDESLMYYGTLYNMSGENIALRSTELCSAFDIDFQKSFIKNLSGGQCRRVSLAISLLHNPKIIVLDEPTVGIDLIISFNIWKYFVSLVKNHDKTIIITTHYIQEAIQADMIGLMRNGRILKETSPQSLLIQQETNSLETAFLKLCQSKEEILVEEVPDISHETSKGPNWFQDNNSDSYLTPHRIRALLKRNYSVISRDFLYTFFMIILPTIQIVISNFSMGNRIEHVNIVISNDEIDISRCSDANFEGCLFNDSYSGTLSCEMFNYLKYLNYDFVEVNNKDDGFNTVNLGEAIAFVHFPHNYTKGLRQHVIRNASYVYESESLVYLHSQNYVFKSQIFYDLHNVLNHVLDNAMTRCSANKKTVKIPMDIKREFGINVESLRDTLIGFIIVICSFYFASVCSASFMLMEKQDGLLSRTRLSGVTILEVIIALVVIQSFVYIFQMSIMIFVTYYIFPNTIEKLSNIYLMSVVFIFTFWVGFLYGVIVAGISRNSTEVMFLTFGYGLSAVMVGGSLWPVESQYSLIQQISYNLPISVAARLINNFVHKTLSIIHPVMLIDYAKLIGHVFVHSAGKTTGSGQDSNQRPCVIT
ncbi:ABC transporter G family member 23-like [Adelges cooleyi]|uniref:ABC transporter G family member 23-like n=1 Tax=Adelges cooleyi TaxID=133065 RepID=UPI0021808F45|nr:ABC transporter G family member 23-like [Adelges cooleyi]XP_050440721.1 ABC transporter G family member 23-like [Adelges cooleyi]